MMMPLEMSTALQALLSDATSAPVVKWISQLTSDQSFWVRVLAGAQMSRKPPIQAVFC